MPVRVRLLGRGRALEERASSTIVVPRPVADVTVESPAEGERALFHAEQPERGGAPRLGIEAAAVVAHLEAEPPARRSRARAAWCGRRRAGARS